ALTVHDDDVFFYNLCYDGADLDGYNSNPQYFEIKRVPDDTIRKQLHDPRAFAPLLPEGADLPVLEELLDRGWWSAWKGNRLDSDGLPPHDEPGFIFEG